jgi:hypothetical protein
MYKVMVGPGDKVAPGDPLIVMIAMKMEYVIKVISINNKLTSVADPGCLSRIPDLTFSIPDPNLFHLGSRIHIKEFKYVNPKSCFLSSRKYDPGCSSWIRIRILIFLPIPDSGSSGQKGTGSRIRIRNTEINNFQSYRIKDKKI